jgi:hypothetical protein
MYAFFAILPVIGLTTIVFTRVRNAEPAVKEAKMVGYTTSEEEKRRLEDRFRELGTLYLLVPVTYTILWTLLVFFVVEPTGILALEGVGSFYVAFTWTVPMLMIVFLVIPYCSYRRYPDTRVLVSKSVEGARLIRRKRKLGEASLEDLRIMNEDASNENSKE